MVRELSQTTRRESPVRDPFTRLYVHLVWATWDRSPLITPEIRPRIYRCMGGEAPRLGCRVGAIGGIEDHVHVLVRTPATIAPAVLAKQLKGVSSHLMNHAIENPMGFRWQGSYGVFSVSKRFVPHVRDYLLRQEEHHRLGTIHRHFEPE